jgi:hypothetical protein
MERGTPQSGPSRAAAIGATTTTLLALLAVASASAARPVPLELRRTAVVEAGAVRAVAAVVVAAARDLLGLEVTGSALAAATRDEPWASAAPAPVVPPVDDGHERPGPRLAERMLDLPPPAC